MVAWTRCRRCARRLTNPTSTKDGVGPECSTQEPMTKVPPRCRLMDACDQIEAGLHLVTLPAEREFHARRLVIARQAIESEDRIPKSIERHVLGTASFIQTLTHKNRSPPQ